MLQVQSTLDFIQDLPLYKEERPYVFTPDGDIELDESHPTLNTVKLHDVPVTLTDIRDSNEFALGVSGFEKADHTSKVNLSRIHDRDAREEYRKETAAFLEKYLDAEYVFTYNVKVRLLLPAAWKES